MNRVTSLLIGISVAALVGCDTTSNDASDIKPEPTPPPPAITTVQQPAPTTQPDNTGINTRDRNSKLPTAGMQGEGKSDIDLTANIRHGIMQQRMSINAQNVKIITQNGKVTLRGPVNSDDEKRSIGLIANSAAGQENVDNQLEVKSNGQ